MEYPKPRSWGARAAVAFAVLGSIASSSAGAWAATARLGKPAKELKSGVAGEALADVPGLSFHLEEGEVERRDEPGRAVYFVLWKGRFQGKDQSLLFNDERIQLGPEGEFSWEGEVQAPEQTFLARAVAPDGKITQVEYRVKVEGWEELTRAVRPPKRWALTPSLGFSYVSYGETGINTYSYLALSAKASFRWIALPPRLDVETNVFANLVPLYRSDTSIEARQLGANLRVGYLVTNPRSAWSFGIAGGMYLAAMFVTNDAFGFRPLLYPQLFPTLRYRTGKGDVFGSYLKYVPMDRNFNPFSIEHREIGGGLSWTRGIDEYRRWGLSLDVTDMRFQLTAARLSRTSTLSLSGVFVF